MSEPASGSDDPWRGGCVIALAIVIAPVLVVAVWRPRGLVLSEEWLLLLMGGLQLALPFGYLALSGSKDWRPWSVATFLTLVSWGLLRKFGGPGLGAALISLAIPLLITVAAWASNRNARS